MNRQTCRLPLGIRSSLTSVRLSLACGVALLPLCASAQTWIGTVSSDYETAGNWNPSGVPNSSGANLVFGTGAGTTNVTLSTPYPAGYTSVGSITFNDPVSAYAISVSNTAYLSISGNVVNTSGITQNFSVTGDSGTGAASEIILNGVDAGSNVVYTANLYGTIQINGSSTAVSGARFVLNEGSIAFSGSGVLALGPVSGVGILAYYGNPSGAPGTFQLGGANDSATLTAQIQEQTGSVAVEKVGTGTLTLDGPSTYTGGTALTSGALLAGNNAALGTGTLAIANGTLFGSADGQPVSLSNPVTLASGSETIDTTGGDLALTGAITETGGSAALTKTGTGSLILAADESYSGGTTISGGALQLGNGGTSGSILGNIVDNGTLNFDRSDAIQFGQVISGSGGVGQVGTGTVALTAVNSFTGAVTVAAGGTLALSGAGSIATASGVTADGTFDISGATSGASIKSLSGTGAVVLGNKTLTLTQAGGTYSGTVNGTGGLTVSSGTEILTGSNTYTGKTTIAAGSTLQLGDGGATGSIAGDVGNAGTLVVNRSGDVTIAGAISGIGSVEKAGTGTLTLSGNNSYSGGTVVSAGTLSLLTDMSAGTGTITLGDGTALALANGLDVTNALSISGKVDLIVANGSAVESGVLSGTGTYSLSGGGTLHLTGNNSGFTGTTVLSGLTVDLATDSALGAGAARVVGSASLHYENGIVIANAIGVTTGSLMTAQVGSGASATQMGAISGNGGLAKTGDGAFILTGNNLYTGGTTISAGTLQLGNGGTSGSIVGNVVDKAALIFDRSDDIAFAGAISGTGRVEQDGAGSLTLTGNSSYGDGTALNTGTLVVGNANAIGTGTLAMAAGTTLGFGGSFTLANAITVSGDPTFQVNAGTVVTATGVIANGAGAGDIVKTGAGTLILTGTNSYSGGTTISAGTLQLGNGGTSGSIVGNVVDNGVLTFDRSDAVNFGGSISGSGTLRQAGAGTLTLTANDAAFAGITEVANGTLSVNTTLGGTVVVDSGATLAGTGTVGSAKILSGGTLSPAGTGKIGTLTVKGNLSLASGSTYTVDVDPTGSTDLVHATGTATLGGGKIAVIAATGNWLVSTRYTILTANAGVSGTFGSVGSNFAFLTPTLGYDADDVFLTLTRNNVDFASLAVTPNQRATANGLASLAGGALANAVVQLSAAQAPSAFNQLSGEIQASVRSVLIDDSRFVRDAGIDRIRSAFGGAGASTASVTAYSDGSATAAAATADGPAFWSEGYGSWGHNDSDGNAAKASHSIGGFLAGADAPIADGWRAGVLAGYGRTTFDASGSGSSDNYSLGVYGGNQWGALGLRLGMAYSWNDIDTRRSVAFTGFRDSLSAGYNAQTVQGFGDLGYTIPAGGTPLGQIVFEPFVGLAYVGIHTDGFAERGGAAALSARADDTGETFSTLGLRVSDGFALNGLQLTAIATAGWRHSYDEVAPTSTLRFIGSNAFTVAGVPIARDAAVIEAGLSSDVTQNVSLSVTYTGQYGNGTQDQGVRGNIAWKF